MVAYYCVVFHPTKKQMSCFVFIFAAKTPNHRNLEGCHLRNFELAVVVLPKSPSNQPTMNNKKITDKTPNPIPLQGPGSRINLQSVCGWMLTGIEQPRHFIQNHIPAAWKSCQLQTKKRTERRWLCKLLWGWWFPFRGGFSLRNRASIVPLRRLCLCVEEPAPIPCLAPSTKSKSPRFASSSAGCPEGCCCCWRTCCCCCGALALMTCSLVAEERSACLEPLWFPLGGAIVS